MNSITTSKRQNDSERDVSNKQMKGLSSLRGEVSEEWLGTQPVRESRFDQVGERDLEQIKQSMLTAPRIMDNPVLELERDIDNVSELLCVGIEKVANTYVRLMLDSGRRSESDIEEHIENVLNWITETERLVEREYRASRANGDTAPQRPRSNKKVVKQRSKKTQTTDSKSGREEPIPTRTRTSTTRISYKEQSDESDHPDKEYDSDYIRKIKKSRRKSKPIVSQPEDSNSSDAPDPTEYLL